LNHIEAMRLRLRWYTHQGLRINITLHV